MVAGGFGFKASNSLPISGLTSASLSGNSCITSKRLDALASCDKLLAPLCLQKIGGPRPVVLVRFGEDPQSERLDEFLQRQGAAASDR